MTAKRLRGESGYSLIEVMVSIMIMTIAILPMIAMFDMGFHSTTVGSNYDKARMLANLKLEEAKNLPYNTVRDNFPEPVGTTTTYDTVSGIYQSGPKTEPGFPNSMTYVIEKRHMALFPTASDGSEDFEPNPTNTGLTRVKVTVQWSDSNGNPRSYETFGMVAQ